MAAAWMDPRRCFLFLLPLQLLYRRKEAAEDPDSTELGCPLPEPELISPVEPGPESQTSRSGPTPSSCLGDNTKPETPQPAPSHPAPSEEVSPQKRPTQQASGHSQLGQTKDADRPLEMREGPLRPGTGPQGKELPGKVKPDHHGLGTDDCLPSRTAQQRVPPGDILYERESLYTAKLSRVFKQKRKRHGREEEVQTQLSDFHDEPVAVCRPLPEGEEDSITVQPSQMNPSSSL
ncbi:hypothetical protein E5288_WYG007428 [Bos mutus]|uniref:Uncharacterized protein n=1 Tax=Bos mutus TaxID=72004 RepID=A0A6B0SCJ2_9CETA|nr:hypothetical protein [Bos mutus]